MPRGALFGQKENFTVCFSGKRRSLLHLNTAQRSFFPLQSFSRKTSRKYWLEKSVYYSYFEKSCRKKCTRQCRKVLQVVLSSLFFKEICKNGTRGHGLMFIIAKGKKQQQVRQLQCQEQVIIHIPYYLSGLSRTQFFRQPFSKQLYTCILSDYIGSCSCPLGIP